MSSSYDREIEELLAGYGRQRDQAFESRQQINAVTATVTAPRQVVRVTVGAQGQITDLDFPTGAYRNMAPKDLARVVRATVDKARAEALKKVTEVVTSVMPGGIPLADLLEGKFDPRVFLPEELPMPDVVREYVDHGFRGSERGGPGE
ncbi:YbaB/EbfC family nucleoid-associated protein [Streptomyces sp. NPDC048663]|uniref:YbaB/EbfC family nucleoid-associated protein n=1 Tax=Streptomyces sp. NPDC048663 TaxID=3155638 RepID=UPI003436B8F7